MAPDRTCKQKQPEGTLGATIRIMGAYRPCRPVLTGANVLAKLRKCQKLVHRQALTRVHYLLQRWGPWVSTSGTGIFLARKNQLCLGRTSNENGHFDLVAIACASILPPIWWGSSGFVRIGLCGGLLDSEFRLSYQRRRREHQLQRLVRSTWMTSS